LKNEKINEVIGCDEEKNQVKMAMLDTPYAIVSWQFITPLKDEFN